MMRPGVRGLNSHRGMGGMPINLSEFSDKTCQIADSVVDSLLASNDLLPVQWAGALRRRVESRERRLLREVFASAWEDLASPTIVSARKRRTFSPEPTQASRLACVFFARSSNSTWAPFSR